MGSTYKKVFHRADKSSSSLVTNTKRIFALPLFSLMLSACTVETKDEGKLPDVDIEGGRAPDIDVDPARIEVSTDTQKIITPDVDVSPSK